MTPICKGCKRHPFHIEEYKDAVEEEGIPLTPLSVERWVRQNEGTYNRATGRFWCPECYLKAGMPPGVA